MDIFLELLAVGLLIALGDQLPIQVLVYAVISIQESLHSERPITSEYIQLLSKSATSLTFAN
jgi:hypothetical protein